jgi:hypothetical protein
MNFDEITLIYKVAVDKFEVKIFNKEFVERYKNNCKIISNGWEQELKEIYTFGFFETKKDKNCNKHKHRFT